MNKTRFILCLSLVLMIALTLGLSIFSNSTAVCENHISEEECILKTRIIEAKKNLRYYNQYLENDSQEIQVKFLDKYKNELDKLNFTNIEIARMMTLAMGYPEEIVDDLEDEILLDNLNVKESSLYVSNRSLSAESPTMYSGYKTYVSESGSMTNPTYKITTYFKWEQTPSNLYSDYIALHYPYEFLCTDRFNHYSIDTERYWLKWKYSYFHADSNGIVRSDYEENRYSGYGESYNNEVRIYNMVSHGPKVFMVGINLPKSSASSGSWGVERETVSNIRGYFEKEIFTDANNDNHTISSNEVNVIYFHATENYDLSLNFDLSAGFSIPTGIGFNFGAGITITPTEEIKAVSANKIPIYITTDVIESGVYYIKSLVDDKFLELHEGLVNSGNIVKKGSTSNNTQYQRFKVVEVGLGIYQILPIVNNMSFWGNPKIALSVDDNGCLTIDSRTVLGIRPEKTIFTIIPRVIIPSNEIGYSILTKINDEYMAIYNSTNTSTTYHEEFKVINPLNKNDIWQFIQSDDQNEDYINSSDSNLLPNGSGYYRIKASDTTYLDCHNMGVETGTDIRKASSNVHSQLFYISISGARIRIEPFYIPNMRLDIYNDNMQINTMNNTYSQYYLLSSNNNSFNVLTRESNYTKALSSANTSIRQCNLNESYNNQKWTFEYYSNQFTDTLRFNNNTDYYIKNLGSSLYWQSEGSNVKQRTKINNSDEQKYRFSYLSNGNLRIIPKNDKSKNLYVANNWFTGTRQNLRIGNSSSRNGEFVIVRRLDGRYVILPLKEYSSDPSTISNHLYWLESQNSSSGSNIRQNDRSHTNFNSNSVSSYQIWILELN